MSDLKLGQIIEGNPNRDAVHMAVAPVIAAESLAPGQHVGFVAAGKAGETTNKIGVVDPFLKAPVKAGQRVWLFMYPNTITGLRHEWTHPAFEPPPSEKWLRQFAENSGIGYETLIEGAEVWINRQDYLCLGGLLEGCSVPDDFWIHYQAVFNKVVPEEKQGNFFTCSC